MGIFLAGMAALMYGAADFCGGMGTRRSPLFTVLVVSQLVGLLLAVAGALILRQEMPSARDVFWGAIAGVCGAAGLAALYTAIADTLVAVASPVAAVMGAAIPLLLGVAGGERPGALAWAGIALAIPAILFLTMGPSHDARKGVVRRAALLGTAAGVGFGLFFFAIAHTGHGSGLWPLAAARVATVSIVVAIALGTRKTLRPTPAGLPLIVLSGVLDMGANIAFLLSSRAGMLAIAAVVSSLYPGPTVLLAALVLRERLGAARIVGLGCALVGVALIAL